MYSKLLINELVNACIITQVYFPAIENTGNVISFVITTCFIVISSVQIMTNRDFGESNVFILVLKSPLVAISAGITLEKISAIISDNIGGQ